VAALQHIVVIQIVIPNYLYDYGFLIGLYYFDFLQISRTSSWSLDGAVQELVVHSINYFFLIAVWKENGLFPFFP
jgi:hypothetical protein